MPKLHQSFVIDIKIIVSLDYINMPHWLKNSVFIIAPLFLYASLSLGINVQAVSTTLSSDSFSSANSLTEKMTSNTSQLSGLGLIIKNKLGTNKESSIKRFNLAGVKFQNSDTYTTSNQQTTIYSFGSIGELKTALKSALLDPSVDVVQPNFKYHFSYTPSTNPKFNSTDQWYLQNGVGTLNAPAAWDAMQSRLGLSGCDSAGANKECGGIASTKIAVIDSGVNTNITQVPEFVNTNFDNANSIRYYNNANNSCNTTRENDTILQDENGNAVVFCKKIGSQFDEVGHGSVVAQQIAAGNNTSGGVGLGYNLTILPIALHGRSLNTYYIAKAIDYATDKGASVINLSLGSSQDSYGLVQSALTRAISRGVIAVASSGNCGDTSEKICFGDNSLSNNINPIIYPAAFSNVISVGATNYGTVASSITRSSYSNFGNGLDFVAAVGGGDASPNPKGVYGQCGKVYTVSFDPNLGATQAPNYNDPCNNKNLGDNSVWYGTSFASPQIAAVVGLMKSLDPAISFDGAMLILKENSTDLGTAGYDANTGWGIPKTDQIVLTMWRNWNQLSGGATVDKPTEQTNFSVNNKIYQAILGNDTKLYTRSASDIFGWSSWQEGAGITLKDTPKMVEYLGKLYQLGFGTDNRMYTRSSVDGLTWTAWQEGAGITLKNTPSLNVFASKLYQTARGTDNRLYTRSSVDGLAWTTWQEGAGVQIIDKPNTITFASNIYQSVLGIYTKIYTRQSSNGTTWSSWTEANGITALNQPDLIVFNSKLHQIVRGNDTRIYNRSSSDGINWSTWFEASGITSIAKPGSFILNSKLYQTCVGSDKLIWFRSKDS